jgi:hypothetical protein
MILKLFKDSALPEKNLFCVKQTEMVSKLLWKDEVVAYFKVEFRHSPGESMSRLPIAHLRFEPGNSRLLRAHQPASSQYPCNVIFVTVN